MARSSSRSSAGDRLRPKKSLGQNFLADSRYVADIVGAADLSGEDVVLEIGPGTGILTRALAADAGHVIAVELDGRLIEPLQNAFVEQPHVQIVHADILDLDPPAVARKATPDGIPLRYKVVANLPYYITSAVLRHLLEANPSPSRIVVMVQWEVAQRICAEPGDLSLLAVSVQYYARPRLVVRVPAHAFSPQPKVDSAVLCLDVRDVPAVDAGTVDFFAVVRAGFSQKRKQLLNSLAAGLHQSKQEIRAALEQVDIDPTRRAETLALHEWGAVCATLKVKPSEPDTDS